MPLLRAPQLRQYCSTFIPCMAASCMIQGQEHSRDALCLTFLVVWQVWEAHKHLNEGIASGEVQPLPWTVYSRDKAQDAFRFLAGGAHTQTPQAYTPA